MPVSGNKSLPWDEVERQIYKEVAWLKNAISTFYTTEGKELINCEDCLLRQIAILIVSGSIQAKEINKGPKLRGFWKKKPTHPKQSKLPKIHHGETWHRDTMTEIENSFLWQGYNVEREPTLSWGRADLGVYKKGEPNLFIEVGTTSLFKLCVNLKTLRGCTYLIVPNDDQLIEFTCFNENSKLANFLSRET